jgi:hypothetical protein
MSTLIPRINIEGQDVDFIDGTYQNIGGFRAATLQFKLPTTEANFMKLWNKEVTYYFNQHDATPIFRGYIKRTKVTQNFIEVYAQDAIGYLVKGGNAERAKVSLTEDNNIDGLTIGNGIAKLITMASLTDKLKTTYIKDTTPLTSCSRPPIRGTLPLLEVIETLISRAVDNSGDIPRPNIIKLIDDGSDSLLTIELESDLDTGSPAMTFSETKNITNVKIVNKKVPTLILVKGFNNVTGEFKHTTAIDAYDINYLEVSNPDLKSPAECVDFAQKIFRANLSTQYEYGIETPEGAYLAENDVIFIDTKDEKFSGAYRVRGKTIKFSPTMFHIGLNINKKPPTLAEFIARQDN